MRFFAGQFTLSLAKGVVRQKYFMQQNAAAFSCCLRQSAWVCG
jgi:hypothetical protein